MNVSYQPPEGDAHRNALAAVFGINPHAEISAAAGEIEALFAAPSAKARRDIIRQPGGQLCTHIGYLVMTVLLAQLRENADRKVARRMKRYRRLLGSPRAMGIPGSWTRRTRLRGTPYSTRALPWVDAFAQALIAWVDTDTYQEERRVLEMSPELLDPLGEIVLHILARTRSSDTRQEGVVRRCQRLLREIRAAGSSTAATRTAYVNEYGGLALDLPPWLEEMVGQLRVPAAHPATSGGEPKEWPSVLRTAIARAVAEDEVAPEVIAELNLQLWDVLDTAASRDLKTAIPTQEEGITCLWRALETFTFEQYPNQYARVRHQLGSSYRLRRSGSRGENLEEAIRSLNEAARVYRLDLYPEEFASTHVNLGNAFQERLQGKHSENLEQAITHYQAALRVYSPDTFPYDYALVQHNLGTLYQNRIVGSAAENLELSIACFRDVLRLCPLNDFPEDHATALMGLGNAMLQRSEGSRRENIEQAITYLTDALQIFTSETYPEDYARTHHNLGNAYLQRLSGPQQDNREVAINHYQETLRVYSLDTAPTDYARSLVGLADCYDGRLEGERSENLEKSLQYYQQALAIFAEHGDTQACALVFNNLGITYLHRLAGDRNDNITQAIYCFHRALEVYTLDDQPRDYALAQLNLAGAWGVRMQGDPRENQEQAIRGYAEALRVYIVDEFPADFAQACFGLGNIYSVRQAGDQRYNIERAMQYYGEALRVYTREAFPVDYRDTQLNIAWLAFQKMADDAQARSDHAAVEGAYERAHIAYSAAREIQADLGWLESTERGRSGLVGQYLATRAMYIRDAWCLLQLGRPREAVVALEAGRTQALAESQALAEAPPDGVCDFHVDAYAQVRHQLRQARASDNRSALRAARDNLLATRQAIRDHCQPEFLAGEPTFEDVMNAPAPDQALIYLAATDRGGLALVVRGRGDQTNTLAGEPVCIPLPLLTLNVVDNWMVRRDDDGLAVGGMRIALEQRVAGVLYHWVLQAGDVDEQERRWALPIGSLGENLPTSMMTMREALDRLAKAWAFRAEQLSHGDAHARRRAAAFRARPSLTLRDALTAGIIGQELAWYFQQVELEHLLPELSATFMSPLRQALNEFGLNTRDDQVALVACGQLGALPLHAALVPTSQAGELAPFQETCIVTYQASARALAAARAAQSHLPDNGPILAIGDPRPTFAAALAYARRSAQQIADHAREAGREASIAVIAEDVTQERVNRELQTMRTRHPGVWVEVASHGRADSADPRKCYMLLANNGRLTLADLQKERLLEGVRCFSASGCVTALGDLELAPDELSSFAAGILQAGAAAAVATLWSVSDRATALLMERFYELIVADPQKGPGAALRDAAAWLRSLSAMTIEASAERHTHDTPDDHEEAARGLAESDAGEGFSEIRTTQSLLQFASPMVPHIGGSLDPTNQLPYAHAIYWASLVAYGA